MKIPYKKSILLVGLLLAFTCRLLAQGDVKVSTRIDGAQIQVGDQARLFITATHNEKQGRLQWAPIPDTINNLEVVEKGKIDTSRQGDMVTYTQRLLITGFDSGLFQFPSLVFSAIPVSGAAYTVQTDSYKILVQTVPVDTTKAFKGIKNIIYVKSTWLDYIWYIVSAALLILLIVFITIYFVRKNAKKIPLAPQGPVITLQEKTLKQLEQLEQQHLWQNGKIKEYYSQLTDIVRTYIEARFMTPALELTTDELLYKARLHKELMPYHGMLATVLNTADLAKFAKAQPLPEEHVLAMEHAKQFVITSKPVVTVTTNTPQQS